MDLEVKLNAHVFSIAVLIAAAASAANAEGVSKMETFSDWTLYADGQTTEKSAHKFCFVTSTPASSEPKGASRDAPHLYISAWPKDGVKAEVSLLMGFPVKAASEPSITVGTATFKLYASDDRIYVKDATQELKLIDAMKKGDELKAEVSSERGTAIVDLYSLSGLGQALSKLQEVCF